MKDYNHSLETLEDACGFNSERIAELTTALVKEMAVQRSRSMMIKFIDDMSEKYPELRRLISYHALHRIEMLLEEFTGIIKKEKRRAV